MKLRVLAALCSLPALASCAITPVSLGQPITEIREGDGYRAATLLARKPDDGILLVLSVSGGGMRSAAFAYGVFEQLAEDRIEHQGRSQRLLDEVDLMSVVSGGALPTAYYALYGDRLFEDFEPRFLYRDLAAGFRRSVLWNPRNWWRLASSEFSRGDLYAEYLDRKLFAGATFADLDRSGRRPFLLINATDIGLAGRFDFTQDSFDVLCDDLDSYPLARAVAASSGVPALLTPITLKNRAGQCGYRQPAWVDRALTSAGRGSREYFRATILTGRNDSRRYAYLHLLDGSLSDNLGVRTALDVLAAGGDPDGPRDLLASRKFRKIVFLVVNAANSQAELIGGRRQPPDTVDMLKLLGTVPMDRYTVESRVFLRETLERWVKSIKPGNGTDIDKFLHLIEVDLGTLEGTRYARLITLPTTLTASRQDVDDLRCAARLLLERSQDYRRLLDAEGGAFTRSLKCPSS